MPNIGALSRCVRARFHRVVGGHQAVLDSVPSATSWLWTRLADVAQRLGRGVRLLLPSDVFCHAPSSPGLHMDRKRVPNINGSNRGSWPWTLSGLELGG